MTAHAQRLAVESASSATDLDARAGHATDGELSTQLQINTYRKNRRQPAHYPTGLTEALLATAAHSSVSLRAADVTQKPRRHG